MSDGGNVVAHANLWPRVMFDKVRGREIQVGLVGNVATDERMRGQGLMSQMFDALKKVADARGLKALVLWSDLLEFYQKQGFQSFGQERRYRYLTPRLYAAGFSGRLFERVKASSLDEKVVNELLERRLPVGTTLHRSAAEFRRLLSIPGLDVFLSKDRQGRVAGYALLGKGVDMVGVIHEWGAGGPEALLDAAVAASEATGFGEILVLAPHGLNNVWHETLSRYAAEVTGHGMALMWIKGGPEASESLAQSFIWGLDSI